MKNFLNISLLILLLVSFCSCKKMLDIKPVNSMMPVTINDYESILLGGYLRNDFFFNTELMTDNVYANLNTTTSVTRGNEPWFLWASSMLLDGNQMDDYWGNLYKHIYYANTVLDNFAARSPIPEEKNLYEKVKGEAYALRAFSYFYLVNMYADTYSADHLRSPGVPMPLTAMDVNTNVGNNVREPLEKVWKQILADLDDASKLLVGKETVNRFRFNYNIVQLLKARVLLFMGDYKSAAETAATVMANNSLTDLNTIQSFIDENEGTSAFMYKVGFIDTDYNKEILMFMGGKANNNLFAYGQAVFKPSTELLDLCKRYGNLTDYRQYIFDSFTQLNTADGIMTGPTMYNMYAKQAKDSYFIGFKASEAYLIRAESYAQLGQANNAVTDLNTLLKNRIKKTVFVPLQAADFSGDGLLKRILEERRLEMAFDGGIRWFDLRRLGKPELVHTYKNGLVNTLKKNDPRYLLQIPPSEYNNSPSMPLNPR